MNALPILAFQKVDKRYDTASGHGRKVLSDISFQLPQGRRVAIVGRSGSGKTTLLHLAAGIDLPSHGDVLLAGKHLGQLSDRKRTLLRRRSVGLIFQFFYLLPHLSIRDNVALPHLIAGHTPLSIEDRMNRLLDRVGLANRAEDPVEKLSGGEMQRVAICRALITSPRLVLADEPTGNLDDETARSVIDLILELVAQEQSTLILVTHSREIAEQTDEIWRIHSGILEAS
jgi:ABC-type lipoprotein export system ATPase subunit